MYSNLQILILNIGFVAAGYVIRLVYFTLPTEICFIEYMYMIKKYSGQSISDSTLSCNFHHNSRHVDMETMYSTGISIIDFAVSAALI